MEELVKMEEEKIDGYEKYELESAIDTLARADEIRKDKKMMAALEPMLKKKAKTYNSLADLRERAKEVMDEES